MTKGRTQSSAKDNDVAVRRVSEDDWRDLRRVRLAALTDAPEAFGSSLQRELDFDPDQWRARTRSAALFMAFVSGSPVGMAAGVGGDSSLERKLEGMWVEPTWRGREVASKLVSAVVDWARSEGSHMVRLWVAEGNESARRFYEGQGFAFTGRRDRMPSDSASYRDEMVLLLAG